MSQTPPATPPRRGTTPGLPTGLPPPIPPNLGAITNCCHPWTGGKPTADFSAMTRTIPRSAHCNHLQDPSEAHRQLQSKTTIPLSNDLDTTTSKKFSHDEKLSMVEEFAKAVIDFVEFHGMDAEFYLPDPQDPTQLCYIL